MIIRLTRSCGGGPPTLTCIRDDGSVTWQPSSEYFARHDLIHYAVETTLGLGDAFFGHVAAGKNINEYGTRNGIKDTYTREEIWAEYLVGLLQWPGVGGGPEMSHEEIVTMMRARSDAVTGFPPAITEQQIGTIRSRVRELHARWAAVQPGGSLELAF